MTWMSVAFGNVCCSLLMSRLSPSVDWLLEVSDWFRWTASKCVGARTYKTRLSEATAHARRVRAALYSAWHCTLLTNICLGIQSAITVFRGGRSTLSLTIKGSWLPWGRVPSLSSARTPCIQRRTFQNLCQRSRQNIMCSLFIIQKFWNMIGWNWVIFIYVPADKLFSYPSTHT